MLAISGARAPRFSFADRLKYATTCGLSQACLQRSNTRHIQPKARYGIRPIAVCGRPLERARTRLGLRRGHRLYVARLHRHCNDHRDLPDNGLIAQQAHS
jgi:hypothetical protein